MKQLAILIFMAINIIILGCDYSSRLRIQKIAELDSLHLGLDSIYTDCGVLAVVGRCGGNNCFIVFRTSDTSVHYQFDNLYLLDRNYNSLEAKFRTTVCGDEFDCLSIDWSSLNAPFYVHGDSVFVSNSNFCKLDTLKIEYVP